jgi:hypothetical protein
MPSKSEKHRVIKNSLCYLLAMLTVGQLLYPLLGSVSSFVDDTSP